MPGSGPAAREPSRGGPERRCDEPAAAPVAAALRVSPRSLRREQRALRGAMRGRERPQFSRRRFDDAAEFFGFRDAERALFFGLFDLVGVDEER